MSGAKLPIKTVGKYHFQEFSLEKRWSQRADSNRRPSHYECRALDCAAMGCGFPKTTRADSGQLFQGRGTVPTRAGIVPGIVPPSPPVCTWEEQAPPSPLPADSTQGESPRHPRTAAGGVLRIAPHFGPVALDPPCRFAPQGAGAPPPSIHSIPPLEDAVAHSGPLARPSDPPCRSAPQGAALDAWPRTFPAATRRRADAGALRPSALRCLAPHRGRPPRSSPRGPSPLSACRQQGEAP